MPEDVRKNRKTQLVLAIARGESITAWARKNEVPLRTAFRWASDPKVHRAVELWRRRAINRAIGRMASLAMKAADGIARLAQVQSPSRYGSGRGGPSWPTRWPFPGSRFSSSGWRRSRSSSVARLETRITRARARLATGPGPGEISKRDRDATARRGTGTPSPARAGWRPAPAACIPAREPASGRQRAIGGSGGMWRAGERARPGPVPAGPSAGSRTVRCSSAA